MKKLQSMTFGSTTSRICILIATSLITACTGRTYKLTGYDTSLAGTPLVHYPGEGGVVILSEYGPASGRFTCVAPPAQAALSLSTKTDSEASVSVPDTAKIKLSGSHEATEAIVKLAELNERSIFLQYALYRLCEAAVNGYVGVPKQQDMAAAMALPVCENARKAVETVTTSATALELSGEVGRLKKGTGSSIAFARSGQVFIIISEFAELTEDAKADARKCAVSMFQNIDYNEFTILYREVLATAATMHADSRKEAEAKLALAKLEAEKENQAAKKKEELERKTKEMQLEAQKICVGKECEATAKSLAFDPDSGALKLKKSDVVYTAPITPSTTHKLSIKGKDAVFEFPSGSWSVNEVGTLFLVAQK